MDALNKKDIGIVYAVSCVERYVLAYLNKLGIDTSLLYYDSFCSVNHLINDFGNKNNSYVQYDAMKRIQDVAKELNILTIKGVVSEDLRFLDQKESEYLLEMNKDSFKDMYAKEAWREDHYFYIKKIDDEKYLYLNDIPLQEKVIDKSELKKLYNNRYLEIKRISDQIDKKKVLLKFCERYEQEKNMARVPVEQLEYEHLRDLLCMLRTSRRRTSDFISQWEEANPLWVNRVNSVFSKVEYSRVRKHFDPGLFWNEIEGFCQDEEEIGACLKKIQISNV